MQYFFCSKYLAIKTAQSRSSYVFLFILCLQDQDNRVREATHQAFEQLIQRVRRSMAPHLRGIMGPWLVAQCDSYAPAASAACSAFKAAFSPTKQSEAIVFCRNEVLAVSGCLLI